MDGMEIFLAALFGLLIGSFLNVVIYRLPVMLENSWNAMAREQLKLPAEAVERFNLLTPPSRCGNCGAPVKPWQNIPIFSWLFLRGKCHSCHTPISIRYPLVEALTGALFALVAWQYGWTAITVWACLLTAFVITLTFIDADHQILPDTLTLPLVWLGLLFNLHTGFVPLSQAVLGAVAGYMSLWTLFWVFKLITGKDGMGYGDFKMLAAVGAWAGISVLPVVILFASVVGIIAFVLMRRHREQAMAFGPCLAIAGWFVFVFHTPVMLGVRWWLETSGF